MTNTWTTLLAAMTLAMPLIGTAQQRDAALFKAAEAAQPAVISTLQDLVLMESGSAHIAGLGRVADYALARLQALGA